MQDEQDFQCMPEDLIESSTYEEEYKCICLRSIDAKRRLTEWTDVTELEKHN